FPLQGVFIPFSLECRFFLLFCEKSDIYGFFLGIFTIFLLVFIFSYIIILKLGSLLYGFYSSISFLIQRNIRVNTLPSLYISSYFLIYFILNNT
ncbi:hypothetical protein ACOCIZ_17850, partial [Acinetobacter baumannii]|uniref:hypothetical protein n=1 Tax=Acinetobacter baumannii TaxID=470 RepID=UPI003B437D41